MSDATDATDFVRGMVFEYQNRTFELRVRNVDEPFLHDVATKETHNVSWESLCEARERGEIDFDVDLTHRTEAERVRDRDVVRRRKRGDR